ncbi:MAG: hypothetical protein Q7U38_18535 [Methylobacter sp.]|nr:hypothetical protein [Methylobacter sp.]MDP2097917.1 hypothetical protein [Methylobacter sp.]MDP2429213.1 hypothetical protein [Methylobacter sp.]MDP3056309.1 hypothetical protein [Methylobacter sp.]MDP3362301.1 hypothetical protein [Methylobacter sp.]
MTGSFLDTTVVIHVADNIEPGSTKSKAFINANQPAAMPFYALRELLAGHVQILCDTHNIIYAAENSAEALAALLKRSPFEGRKREAKIQAYQVSLQAAFGENPSGNRDTLKREMVHSLALRVNGLWRKAHKLTNVNMTQSLGCFNDGKITYGPSGELRGPNNSFNCIKSERCAAAGYLYDDKNTLTNMIEALHPDNLDPSVANKNENTQRRKALKELLSRGPDAFNKSRCRALGDAYFAAMCPAGSVVVTSNIDDHMPLCLALGKKAIAP